MGNQIQKKNEYGTINIWSEQQTYTAGTQFNGIVNLNLHKSFPSQTLNLILSGKEKVKMTKSIVSLEQEGASSEVEIVEDENEFYNYNYPLFTQSGAIFPAGQYYFPFSFTLEETLPGSFKEEWLQDGIKCYGIVEYKLIVGMTDSQRQVRLFDKFEFKVDQRFEESSGFVDKQFIYNLRGYCYSSLGELKITNSFSGNSFQVGQNLHLTLQIDAKKLKTDIKNIIVTLKQNTTLKAQEEEKKISKQIAQTKLMGIKQGTRKINDNALAVTLLIQCHPDQASCNGTLIENEFEVEVYLDPESCQCCGDMLQNSMNIKIFNKQHTNQQPQIDEEYHSQLDNVQFLTFGQEYRMTKDFENQLYLNVDDVQYPENNQFIVTKQK